MCWSRAVSLGYAAAETDGVLMRSGGADRRCAVVCSLFHGSLQASPQGRFVSGARRYEERGV
jgi:hypothetical protein